MSDEKGGVLGKGLNALLPEEQQDEGRSSTNDLSQSKLYRFEDESRMVGRVAEIEVQAIRPNPYQPRQEFREEPLQELSASIQELGIIQPITVRALGEGQFEVISGERRLRAARRAGLQRIPAYVRQAETEQMLEMALVENVQREQLNPIEVALGYQRLIEECDLTQEQVARKVSKNRATVANFLRLLKLPPRVQASLRDGSVTVGHARALINVEDKGLQRRILNEVEDEELTVRDVERRVRRYRKKKEASEEQEGAATEKSPVEAAASPTRDELQVRQYQNRLRERLSTQVQIKQGSDGEGHIAIAYYSNEDLERLMEILG